MGGSIGPIRTAVARQHLRNALAYLDVPTLGQPEAMFFVDAEFFGEGGVIASPDARAFLQGWINRYVAWVKQHAG